MNAAPTDSRSIAVRRRLLVVGRVQGVGFRPFVHGLAADLALGGFVRNELGAVRIEVEGTASALLDFERRLAAQAPPLARVDAIDGADVAPRGDRVFVVAPSASHPGATIELPPDMAPCDACLAELCDPKDRRYRYPFLNCTQCGPRLTLVEDAPYDRARTTMASFAMCADCRREYEDPTDRRFHAQPVACPACGPRLVLQGFSGDPIEGASQLLAEGKIVAIKGVGGYHLACDAADDAAVARLRQRKHRDEKAFALMAPDLAAAERWCVVDAAAAALLTSPARPIVVLPVRDDGAARIPSIAPGMSCLGIMLPPTPLHYLLAAASGSRPLVMTSGNRSDEPMVFDDDDARERLAGIADALLTHDRPIATRCDDSVVRTVAGEPVLLRRARGAAPASIRLPSRLRVPTFAAGGMLKSTFALGHGASAILSHHLGDLEHLEAARAYADAARRYESLFRLRAERFVCDLHPDYPSTRWAEAQRDERGAVVVPMQHHHAHMASCIADAELEGPVIGVVFDGGGLGADGRQWGGEFFVGDCREVRRVAHLAELALVGGDRAAREGWRVALAWCAAAEVPFPPGRGLDEATIARAKELVRAGTRASTTSAGRLFDAVRWLVGGANRQSFEGQAAMELEALATRSPVAGFYPFTLTERAGAPFVVETSDVVRAAAWDLATAGAPPSVVARRFHATLTEAIVAVCRRIREEHALGHVVLSGGVFQNALLTEETCARLRVHGFRPHTHRRVPPNDGGLALGQLAHAAALDRGPRSAPCA